jgi:Flp pilus assembly protein TadD
MRMCKGRVLVATLVGPLLLGGCETSTKLGDLFNFKAADSQPADDPQTTASVPESTEATSEAPNASGLLGSDPYDDLNTGKKLYRSANYGLAERHFRRAVESRPKDAEAWVGLAASYDQLRRFELADRAYAQAVGIVGTTPEVLNNQGYSYILRGDYTRARVALLQAKAKDPKNPYIQSNLELLERAVRKRKGVQQK